MEDEHSLVLDVNAAFNLDTAHGGGARKTLSTSTPSLAAATSSLASARAFFGIYDGHGGVEAATFVKDRLLPNIVRHPAFATNPRKVVNSPPPHSWHFLRRMLFTPPPTQPSPIERPCRRPSCRPIGSSRRWPSRPTSTAAPRPSSSCSRATGAFNTTATTPPPLPSLPFSSVR